MKLDEIKHLIGLLPKWNGKARASAPVIEKLDLQLKVKLIETLQGIEASLDNLASEVNSLQDVSQNIQDIRNSVKRHSTF